MSRNPVALLMLAMLAWPFHTFAQEQARPVPTELWRGGDDGLTMRFSEAVTNSLSKSRVFAAPTGGNRDGLVLTIPTNLYWQEVNGKTNFQYVVVFTDKSSKYLGISIGACWEAGMNGCADTVVEDAERIWSSRP